MLLPAKQIEKAAEHYRAFMEALGMPLNEETSLTPRRVARMFANEFCSFNGDPPPVAKFRRKNYDQYVVVRDITVHSICIPSRQNLNAIKGSSRASDILVGDELWTLHGGRIERTRVDQIEFHDTRDLVEVETERFTVRCTPDHPWATPLGWMEAQDLEGQEVEWVNPRCLGRRQVRPKLGRDFGYALGAIFSDGTTDDRFVSLVVNKEEFARKFCHAIQGAFGLYPRIEPISRPSGFTGKDTPGFRVRIVNAYLADLIRMYAGGEAHHMRQKFPRVVLNNLPSFQGFLEGYIDGDGNAAGKYGAHTIVSGNAPFLRDLGSLIGVRPYPTTNGEAVYVGKHWLERHGFQQEEHRTDLVESEWVRVASVRQIRADGNKPFTVYSFKCSPYPTFLAYGHLLHNCEHHHLPFSGVIHVGYHPREWLAGLSKIPRVVHYFAGRPQLQEHLVSEIAAYLMKELDPHGVMVVCRASHSCMRVRGVRDPRSETVTSKILPGPAALDKDEMMRMMGI